MHPGTGGGKQRVEAIERRTEIGTERMREREMEAKENLRHRDRETDKGKDGESRETGRERKLRTWKMVQREMS